MMNLNWLFSLLLLWGIFSATNVFSSPIDVHVSQETVYMAEDQQIFQRYIDYIRPWQSAPIDSLLDKTATFFLGTPYVAHTLEMEGEERLVVNLRELDCTTFVESVIALVRTVLSDDPDFATFLHELRQIRYRDANLNGYASRLHYTSDWLYDNEKMGVLRNISIRLGGIRQEKRIDFMTTHRDAYRQLKVNDGVLRQMQVIENDINRRGGFYYLPKRDITSMVSKIPHMSVIAFTTSIKGLDVTHMGFAFQTGEGRLTFIHASSTLKKVVIDQKTLSDYCTGQSSCTGIIVGEIL